MVKSTTETCISVFVTSSIIMTFQDRTFVLWSLKITYNYTYASNLLSFSTFTTGSPIGLQIKPWSHRSECPSTYPITGIKMLAAWKSYNYNDKQEAQLSQRETVRHFVSWNILLSHSSDEQGMCKSLLVLHWNYVCILRYSALKHGMTLKPGVGVFQSHWKWHHYLTLNNRDLEIWVIGHWRSFKVVPVETFSAVSYLPSIVTMAVSLTV